MSYHVRDIRLPEDKSAILSFIRDAQHFEHAFEPDRRLDPAVEDEYFTEMVGLVTRTKGRISVAEEDGY